MSTDTPLDLDALLERFGDAYAAAYVEQTDASDARREEAAEAIRAALAAARAEIAEQADHLRWAAEQIPLAQAEAGEEAHKRELAEQERDAARRALAAVTAERDAYRKAKAENDERFQLAAAEAREELAAAREQAKQAQAVVTRTLAELTNPMWYGLLDEDVAKMVDEIIALLKGDATPAAAPKADEPKPAVCPAEYTRPGGRQRGDRIVRCHLPYGHGGEHEEAETECTWLDAEPVPAGGEDGSGTADGGVPA